MREAIPQEGGRRLTRTSYGAEGPEHKDLGLDGKQYILGLRRRLLQEWPGIFGNGENSMLLEKVIALFANSLLFFS